MASRATRSDRAAGPATARGGAARRPSALDAAMRSAVHRVLRRAVRGDRLSIVDGGGTTDLGAASAAGLHATVRVHSPAAYGALVRGSRGLASGYADGLWDCDDLVVLVRILARAIAGADGWRHRVATVTAPLERAVAWQRSNRRPRSRDNVQRHYDLGNDFFGLVLDDTMGYSCAWYEHPDVAPLEASIANLERVCRLLDLRAGHRVLEMGSGWGGFAIHAARHHRCHVSTVTISPSQRDFINAAAARAGVGDRVEVLLRDYRDVRGAWDRLVSLEMVESVGAQHLDAFVAQCGRLLLPEGLMVMQAITTHDRNFRIDRYRRTFLNELIFRGGCVPSLEAIIAAAARHTDLRVVAVADITDHYPPTLRAWRERLEANWPRIERLGGFDEPFRRLWRLYFSWCEAGFLERRVQDRQIVLAGARWRDEGRLLGADARHTPAAASGWQTLAARPVAMER